GTPGCARQRCGWRPAAAGPAPGRWGSPALRSTRTAGPTGRSPRRPPPRGAAGRPAAWRCRPPRGRGWWPRPRPAPPRTPRGGAGRPSLRVPVLAERGPQPVGVHRLHVDLHLLPAAGRDHAAALVVHLEHQGGGLLLGVAE